jgi:putative flippase GtrA
LQNKKEFNKEIINYGIWGILTSIWNIGIFQIFLIYKVDYKIANAIALITTKALAYIVNKLFVFKAHSKTNLELLFEIVRYIIARSFTMIIDFFGLIFLNAIITPKIGKIIITIVVIVLNYILGKFHVYKKGMNNEINNTNTMLQ